MLIDMTDTTTWSKPRHRRDQNKMPFKLPPNLEIARAISLRRRRIWAIFFVFGCFLVFVTFVSLIVEATMMLMYISWWPFLVGISFMLLGLAISSYWNKGFWVLFRKQIVRGVRASRMKILRVPGAGHNPVPSGSRRTWYAGSGDRWRAGDEEVGNRTSDISLT